MWIDKLPAGILRDHFALGYVAAQCSKKEPEMAAEWAVAIETPEIRSLAVRYSFNELFDRDREVAMDWINSLPNLEDRYRAAIIRSAR
jgi:hypothetical protein